MSDWPQGHAEGTHVIVDVGECVWMQVWMILCGCCNEMSSIVTADAGISTQLIYDALELDDSYTTHTLLAIKIACCLLH